MSLEAKEDPNTSIREDKSRTGRTKEEDYANEEGDDEEEEIRDYCSFRRSIDDPQLIQSLNFSFSRCYGDVRLTSKIVMTSLQRFPTFPYLNMPMTCW